VLPSNLLSVWKRKDTIQPRFAEASGNNIVVAQTLIDAYKKSVGKKKGSLKKVGGELEDEGYDFHFVRGLSLLLDRRSVFKCTSQTDPPELRRKLFQETGKIGLATNLEKRNTIIKKVASEMKLSSQEVEDSIYADLESELTLQHFEPIKHQPSSDPAFRLNRTQIYRFRQLAKHLLQSKTIRSHIRSLQARGLLG
jgi:predicted nuclease of restriction endonuclease-like RecB superfamily